MKDQPQEYELTALEIGDFKDNYGNTWVTAAFKGISEPIRWVVKDPSEKTVGELYYGRITEETSKAGKPYLRFRSVLKEDAKIGLKHQTAKQYKRAADERGDGMRQGMCFNNANQYVTALTKQTKGMLDPEQWAIIVSEYAQALYLRSDLSKAEEFETKPDVPETEVSMDDINQVFGIPEEA